MNNTKKALLARGFSTELADKLITEKYTLARLKECNNDELVSLGLTANLIEEIESGARPPIPYETLSTLLHFNRWRCCVCREEEKSIIVHHITPWAESKDHSIENLAVLCHEHHDLAHSKKTLSQNLSIKNIKSSKKKWENEVAALDARNIREKSILNTDCWYYFNHTRLLEIAKLLSIDPQKIPGFEDAHIHELVDNRGLPRDCNEQKPHMYNHGQGRVLYFYMRSLLEKILSKKDINNISDFLSRDHIKAIARPGDMIFIQGKHVFKKMDSKRSGIGQLVYGKRVVNSIQIEYSFDAWEATSTSSWAVWLTGTQSCGSLCHLKQITVEHNKILLKCTVLGICFGLNELKSRDYGPHPSNQFLYKNMYEEYEGDEILTDIESP